MMAIFLFSKEMGLVRSPKMVILSHKLPPPTHSSLSKRLKIKKEKSTLLKKKTEIVHIALKKIVHLIKLLFFV